MRAILWVAGLIALLVAIVGWVGPAEPYQAPWAWISFIGMCIVDDFLLGSKDDARWGELPKVALLAAVIVFRRHPEITVLVAVTAAPLASLLKGQTWPTQVTTTSQWVLAAVFGAGTFRLVGFGDTAHFVAATAAVMVVYYALGPVLSATLEAGLGGTPLRRAFARHRRLAISLEFAGVLLALAWRTPFMEPAALKVADGALVTVAGIILGFVLGGRSSRVFKASPSLPVRPLLGAGAVLLLSQLTPSPLSWLLPLALAIAAGIWAAWRHVYPVVCGALGAYCNELVRAANGGRMPVEGHGMLSTLGNRTDTVGTDFNHNSPRTWTPLPRWTSRPPNAEARPALGRGGGVGSQGPCVKPARMVLWSGHADLAAAPRPARAGRHRGAPAADRNPARSGRAV